MSVNWTRLLAGYEMIKITTFIIGSVVVLWTTTFVPSFLVVNGATAAFLVSRVKHVVTTHPSQDYNYETEHICIR